MRRIVDLAWLTVVAGMAATWPWVPEWVGQSHEALAREHYMTLMLGLTLILPWLMTRGTHLLAPRAPALLSLPNKDHWLAPEHRETTLVQLDERLAPLALGLTLLLAGVHAGVHAEMLLQAHPEWPQLPGAAWVAGAVVLSLGLAAWLMAFMRHFGQRPLATAPRPPRRRRSRNGELVWRESQPRWLMYPILAGTALFALKIHESAHESPPIFVWTVCALVLLLLGRLVTEVRGDSLRWYCGWLGWPRWRIDLDDIVSIEPARSTWLEGWGIRTTGEGMLYNSSGTQAVRLVLRDGRRLRLGSQQPQRLLDALRSRLDRD